MREKILSLIVTFDTVTQAMACEKVCQIHHVSGRLIPIPRELSSGCGLAWKGDIKERELLAEVFKKEAMGYASIVELLC